MFGIMSRLPKRLRRLRRSMLGGLQSFLPPYLFSNNEPGAWYDADDLTDAKLAYRRNLLTWTESFDNAAWSKDSTTVTANSIAAPDGTTTADSILETATTNVHRVEETITITAGTTNCLSYYVRANGRTFVTISINAVSTATDWAAAKFDLTLGTVASTSSGGNGLVTASGITNVGFGWFWCYVSGTVSTATLIYPILGIATDGTTYSAGQRGCETYAGDIAKGIYIWGAQLELGTTATAYQKVTDWNTEFLAAFPSHALYQDAAGTLAVKTMEDPMGLVLDKKNGLVLGPELVTNGDFSSATGWTAGAGWTISGGVANSAGGVGTNLTPIVSINAKVGATYLIVYDLVSKSGGNCIFAFGGINGASHSTPGTYREVITATSTGVFTMYSGTFTGSIDNISVREIPGTHLVQPTSGNRPTWTRRVNILNATATLATQTATTIAAQYKLSFTGAGSIALSGTATGTITAGTTLVTCTAGTLTLTVTGAVTLADMRLSSDVATPAYQAVVSATSYDYTGFPSKIKHNGTNSFLYTASTMDLSATDKVTVFAGVQKLSDGSTQVIHEFSSNWTTNAGSFICYTNTDGATSHNYAFGSKGSAAANSNQVSISGTYTAPISDVVSSANDIAGDLTTLRVNGVAQTASTGDKGTGNFGNYTLYVGARAGASLWFNGAWTQLIIRGALTSDAQVAQAERFVATKTGVTL